MSGFPSTATYGSITDEALALLQGFTVAPDQMTVLSADASATDTTFSVEDASAVSRGVAEIGDELVYLKQVDEVGGTATTNPAWRGFRGTQAEAHPAGTVVRFAPAYPRAVVKRQINNVLASLYPDIFAVRALTLTASPTSPHYDLPASAAHVVDVRWKYNDIDGWHTLEDWDISHSAPTGATGVTLDLYGIVQPGVTIQVLYAEPVGLLANEADDFAVTTGLSPSAKDVVVYGTVYQLAQAMDLARIPTQTVSASELTPNKPIGSALQTASGFGKQYQAALQREQMSLKAKYPARIHRVR